MTASDKVTPSETSLRIQVVYALPDRQAVVATVCPPGTTVADAIRACGILAQFPEIDLGRNPVGIFGERVTLDTPVADADRIEIYRPLVIDPKTVRRARTRRRRI